MPFVKGQTGNPNGAPKKAFSFAGTMRQILSTVDPKEKKERGKVYANRVYELALNGDPTALKLIANYIDGMPKQSVDQNVNVNFEKVELTDDEA